MVGRSNHSFRGHISSEVGHKEVTAHGEKRSHGRGNQNGGKDNARVDDGHEGKSTEAGGLPHVDVFLQEEVAHVLEEFKGLVASGDGALLTAQGRLESGLLEGRGRLEGKLDLFLHHG